MAVTSSKLNTLDKARKWIQKGLIICQAREPSQRLVVLSVGGGGWRAYQPT